jgi:hypothetical protein
VTKVTKREELEAAVNQAEAALVDTVAETAKVEADRDEASAEVERARARCRQFRAALVELGDSNFITQSREPVGASITRSEERPKRAATANPPSRRSRVRAGRGENKRLQDENRQRKPIHRFNYALAASPTVRESVGLLALLLAYFQYYYIDVQLQIVSLHPVTTLLLS